MLSLWGDGSEPLAYRQPRQIHEQCFLTSSTGGRIGELLKLRRDAVIGATRIHTVFISRQKNEGNVRKSINAHSAAPGTMIR